MSRNFIIIPYGFPTIGLIIPLDHYHISETVKTDPELIKELNEITKKFLQSVEVNRADLFSWMTSAEYSQPFNDMPMAKIGETIHFIKTKPLENEPSKYISKPKHNFKKR